MLIHGYFPVGADALMVIHIQCGIWSRYRDWRDGQGAENPLLGGNSVYALGYVSRGALISTSAGSWI